MRRLWLGLWQRIGGNGDVLYKIYGINIYDNSLAANYGEPHRHYHTLKHIENCLKEFWKARHLTLNPDAIEFAIWYHDAVYDSKAKDNEERSTMLASDVLKSVCGSPNFVQLVVNLIMATQHRTPPTTPDAQLIVDIDLSILGYPEEEFDQYERQIRKEYEWVEKDAFVAGRRAILKSFLGRPNIYSTQFFRDKYEAQAQRNISRSLRELSNRS